MSVKKISLGLMGTGLVLALMAPLAAQQAPAAVPSAAPAALAPDQMRPIHVYIRVGLKSHGEGQHDYPQYIADWSKILTDHGAIVDGGFHFPTAEELANTDVMVMYKGDAGYMTPSERAVLQDYLKRGGGLVSYHDTLCGDDPEWFATILGGAKKHGEVNYTLDTEVPYTIVDKTSPIMAGMSDFAIQDEAFYKMTWAKDNPAERTHMNVLATAKISDTPSARQGGGVGQDVPQIWTYERTIFGGQQYRAFVWMQGHEYKNFTDPKVEPMLLRGIAWAARYPVDTLLNERPARGFGGARGGRAGAPGGRGMGGRGMGGRTGN